MYSVGRRMTFGDIIKTNWKSLFVIGLLCLAAVGSLYCKRDHIGATQEAAYQAAFKWSAMLSMKSAETDCEKPSSIPAELTCTIKEKVSPQETRHFKLGCSTSPDDNKGCRLIARLVP